jgi:hypothetical protein
MIQARRNEEVKTESFECIKINTVPKLRPSRPADWGCGMTVCIAAICESGYGLVFAMDMMVSMGWVSMDAQAFKAFRLSPNWHALFAGDDISPTEPILRSVRKSLKTCSNDLPEVMNVFAGAYQDHLQLQATNQVLSRYHWTLDSFLREGPQALGPEGFADIRQQYETVKFDCEFLVCGFDYEHKAHIFTVKNPGVPENRSQVGFWAVGTGEYMALANLMGREVHIPTEKIERVIYYICEAKFAAERATGVGKSTILVGRKSRPEQMFTLMSGKDFLPIKEAWEKDVKNKIPDNVDQILQKCVRWEPFKSPDVDSSNQD